MANPNELTVRENEVLALAWQCMETEPKVRLPPRLHMLIFADIATQIDFAKLARLSGVSYQPDMS